MNRAPMSESPVVLAHSGTVQEQTDIEPASKWQKAEGDLLIRRSRKRPTRGKSGRCPGPGSFGVGGRSTKDSCSEARTVLTYWWSTAEPFRAARLSIAICPICFSARSTRRAASRILECISA